MHEGRETREQATTLIFCVIYSFIFIFCAFLQRLPGLKTLLLPANTYETQLVTYSLSPQLIYRWVLMIICDFLSLWPRSVWDLKCPSPAEEVHITPRLLTLPYQICFSILDTLSHTHYTSITGRMWIGKETLKFRRCLSCLYDFSPDPLLMVRFPGHAHRFFRQDTRYPLHAAPSLAEWIWAVQQRGNCWGNSCQKLRK